MQQLALDSYFFNPELVASQASGERATTTSLFQKISHIFWTVINALRTVLHLITLPIFTLLDEGLANVLGLQSLRHGTCLTNYVSILTDGGDPSQGGKASGSSLGGQAVIGKDMAEHCSQECKDYFHVFGDNDFSEFSRVHSTSFGEDGEVVSKETLQKEEMTTCRALLKRVSSYILPLMQTTFSGMGTLVSPESKGCMATAGRVAGAVLNFFTPTIRFKYTDTEVKDCFELDPDYSGVALRTKHKVEPWRVGIVGSLAVGLNLGIFKRIFDHPIKFLLGVIEIIAAVALAVLAAMSLALI
ncbi:MAG: hypothetical protein K940chlam2_00238 [Chlamydiae bacterium]|nr:hypothetical protein [Chlamydiota bacterium]